MKLTKVDNPFSLIYDDFRADICQFKSKLMIIIALKVKTPHHQKIHLDLIHRTMNEPGLLLIPTDEILQLFFEVGGKIEDVVELKTKENC